MYANTMGDKNNSGGIDVRVRDAIVLNNRANIASQTYASGNAGSIFLATNDLSLTNGAQVVSVCREDSEGKAGDVTARASGSITLSGKDSGFLNNSFGKGDGGNISVTASSLVLDDGGLMQAGTTASGNAGDIRLKANEIHINGGGIESITFGSGNTGDINVSASSFFLKEGGHVITVTDQYRLVRYLLNPEQ